MSVDTPARIAIIGAGPVGLEAALYARYLGYEVVVYEQHSPAHRLLPLNAEQLPHPAIKNRTSLGLAALRAQSEASVQFDAAALETASQLAENYLLPLAGTDLLVDCIHVGQTVWKIERTDFPDEEPTPEIEAADDEAPTDAPADDSDQEDEFEEFEELVYAPFLLYIRQSDGSELTTLAEVVLDCSGLTESAPIIFESLRIPAEGAEAANQEFVTGEPNLYVLGSHSAAAGQTFTIPAGHNQIRRVFAIIGGRESLNLYETFKAY